MSAILVSRGAVLNCRGYRPEGEPTEGTTGLKQASAVVGDLARSSFQFPADEQSTVWKRSPVEPDTNTLFGAVNQAPLAC